MTIRRRLLIILLPVLLAILACQAVMGPTQAPQPASQSPIVTSLHLPTQALPSPLPSATALASTPSATVPAPTPTATAIPVSPTNALRPTASPLHLQVFEEIWQAVNKTYLYPDFNGLDWNAVHEEYTQLIQNGLSNEEFYQAMREMIRRLGDEHSSFFTPEQARQLDIEYAGNKDFVGIGVYTQPMPEQERVAILMVFPGSPADQAGLKAHDSILAIDGQPIIDAQGVHRERLLGPEGSTVVLTVQSPGEPPRQMSVIRQRITSPLPVPHTIMTAPDGKRIGYLFLVNFFDSHIDEQVQAALEEMTANAPLDGLIIDNRFNTGGMNDVLLNTLAYFANGPVGNFVDRQGEEVVQVAGKNVGGSQTLPMVVLVGPNTASFGEIFPGILKDIGRAYLIGEQTDGNVEILGIHDFSDSSRAWIAEAAFRPLNHPEQNWEQSGIVPDQTVPSQWGEVTQETDPAILAALAYFSNR